MIPEKSDPDALRVLLIEDDETEVFSLKKAFDLLGIEGTILVAETGEKGLEMLNNMAFERHHERLPILVLDINLPGVSGLKTLEIIRSTPLIKDIRVFVWTGSGDQGAQIEAEKLDVEGFLFKSDPNGTYAKTAAMLNDYWKIDRH